MKNTLLLAALALGAAAQSNSSTANGCNAGYFPGTDTVIYTVPYTYQQVMSIIGSFQNLTWSGNPPDTVTLNGPDNTVGTSRFYQSAGADVVETITVYSKPANGPYEEIHTLGLVDLTAEANLRFYGDYDGTTVTPICNGAANTFNFTINFCSNNVTTAGALLHQLHLTDAQTVGKYLGGEIYTSCAAISNSTSSTNGTSSGTSTTNGTSGANTTSTSTPPAVVTASSATANSASIMTLIVVAGGLLIWGL